MKILELCGGCIVVAVGYAVVRRFRIANPSSEPIAGINLPPDTRLQRRDSVDQLQEVHLPDDGLASARAEFHAAVIARDAEFERLLTELSIRVGGSWFWSTVVISPQANDDSVRSQAAIDGLVIMDELELIPEPSLVQNEHAICVVDRSGAQIGYLSQPVALRVSQDMARGLEWFCVVKDVTISKDKLAEVHIAIVHYMPSQLAAERERPDIRG